MDEKKNLKTFLLLTKFGEHKSEMFFFYMKTKYETNLKKLDKN